MGRRALRLEECRARAGCPAHHDELIGGESCGAYVFRFLIGTLFIGGILFGASTNTMAGAESFIPEIQGGAKELDHLIRTRDFVAVIW